MICTPNTHKQYNAEPIKVYKLGDYRGVVVRCWWCDGNGRFRGDRDFDENNRYPHTYRLENERECNV
jgi:hypothetical protein